LYPLKGYTAQNLVKEFLSKCWNDQSLMETAKKHEDTGTVHRRPGVADH